MTNTFGDPLVPGCRRQAIAESHAHGNAVKKTLSPVMLSGSEA
jgi:hypothetical protein